MTSHVETNTRGFPTGGTAIARHLRVKLSAGVLAVAGIADEDIGTIEYDVFTSSTEASVRLKSATGTRKMVAAGAFSAGAVLYAAASGKVDDVVTAQRVGIALGAATAAGDIIEVLTDWAAPRVVGGEIALDGAGATPVTTGLTTILAAHASVKTASALADDIVTVAVNWTGGTLSLYPQEHNGTDPTLAASDSTATVCWSAVGY